MFGSWVNRIAWRFGSPGSPGIISGILQMSAPVQSGNSGGPLIDQSGNVIGVVTWKSGLLFGDGKIEVLQNMNFAVKSSVVTNLLDAHGVPYVTAASEIDEPTTRPRGGSSTVYMASSPAW
jgi:S1-C subfamily serine protease